MTNLLSLLSNERLFEQITSSGWSSLFSTSFLLSSRSRLTSNKSLTDSGLALKWWFDK